MRTTTRLSISFGLGLLLAAGACGGGDDDTADDDDDVACAGAVVGDADGCCPDGANANTDEDCTAECGNGEMEGTEECDDGNTDDGDGCAGDCTTERPPTAYRISTLALRDPHLFALGGFDVTETVNGQISASLTADDPADGFLDLAIVNVFRPANPDASSVPVTAILGAACTAPIDNTTCSAGEESTVVETTASNEDGGCMVPPADTTGSYDPPVGVPGDGRCFVTAPADAQVTAAGVVLQLHDAQLSATYGTGDPPDPMSDGLFMGFMTEAEADAALLPADLPVVGGMPLSALLTEADQDTGPGGETGWWFFFNYTATVVPFTE